MNNMTEAQVAWVAGIIEGEGCFVFNNMNGKAIASVRISVGMTDKDVIDELLNITGIGNIRFKKKQKEHWKDSWTWFVQKQEEQMALINVILPWLKSRRTAKALELKAFIQSRIDLRLPITLVCEWESCDTTLEGRDPRTKFCCRQHKVNSNVKRWRLKNTRDWGSGICVVCAAEYTKGSPSALYCSPECKKLVVLEKQRQHRAQARMRT